MIVSVMFLALVAVNAVATVSAVDALAVHGGSHRGLIVLHAIVQTGIALAFAFFTSQRSEPHRRARQPLALLACAVAMLAVVPMAGPGARTSSVLLLTGDAIAVTGSLWILASVLALGRCFGVLPEARGLVTRGPYRLVRHPVYLGEIVAMAGLTVAAPAWIHVTVLAIFITAQLTRMRLEEAALTEAFPEYATYAALTPRLVPRPLLPLPPVAASQRRVAA